MRVSEKQAERLGRETRISDIIRKTNSEVYEVTARTLRNAIRMPDRLGTLALHNGELLQEPHTRFFSKLHKAGASKAEVRQALEWHAQAMPHLLSYIAGWPIHWVALPFGKSYLDGPVSGYSDFVKSHRPRK